MKYTLALTTLALILAGCGQAPPATTSQTRDDPATRRLVRETMPLDDKRAEFLNRIRAADPRYETIQRALLNEQNELGIILKRDVDLNAIPDLMRSLLTQMAKEFPGEDLTVIAYAPTDPPMKIGTGRLNASTREMTYTPVATPK